MQVGKHAQAGRCTRDAHNRMTRETVSTSKELGMSSSNPVLLSRVQKSADYLGMPESDLTKALNGIGIDVTDQGLQLIESEISSEEVLLMELSVTLSVPSLKLRVAIAILKGKDPFKKIPEDRVVKVTDADTLAEVIKATRNIQQVKDRELIELYDKDRDFEIEQELNRRANNQRFIVLKKEGDKISIDIDTSLELLKRSRKMTVPTIIPGPDNKIVPVYRITELNPEDRVVELCPICGEILWKGYCQKCQVSLAEVPEDSRAYMNLVRHCGTFEPRSSSDRNALVVSAIKGVEDLKQTWPSIASTFDELKLAGNLPKLRKIKELPAEQVADPFHVSGNRKF